MANKYLNKTGLEVLVSNFLSKISGKQATLTSGTNIKTINNNSLLGSGNVNIPTNNATWGNISGTLANQTDLWEEACRGGFEIKKMTQANYNALPTKSETTIYLIAG